MPWWVQSLPRVGRMWPSVSDLKRGNITQSGCTWSHSRQSNYKHQVCVKPDIYWWKAETDPCLSVGQRACVSPLPGDGSIYIRDDYLIIPAPEIDCAIAATGALILGGHAEHHIVRTLLQLQAGLPTRTVHEDINAQIIAKDGKICCIITYLRRGDKKKKKNVVPAISHSSRDKALLSLNYSFVIVNHVWGV